MKKEIRLTYELLVDILQGRELHLIYKNFDTDATDEIIIKPPFDGVFMTHDQIQEMKYASQEQAFEMLSKLFERKDVEWVVPDDEGEGE